MALTIQDFIKHPYIIDKIDEQEYARKDIYIETVASFSRSFYQPIFVVDFYKQDLLYVSGNLRYLCGLSGEQLKASPNTLYFDFVPEDEEEILKEIVFKALELFESFPIEERKDWVLSYDFHLKFGVRKRLIQHQITPLRLTEDGRLWLALCSFSIASRKEIGNATMRRYEHQDYFMYSLKNHVWYYREGVRLTDSEHDVLLMSSQGYTMKEIAARLFKSEDSVKSIKRNLFSKLGVRNITEAVFAAINDNMFH